MQFLPSTWARFGEGDIESARDSIFAAGRYLRASGAPGNLPRALYAYNPSQRYVKAITLYAQQIIKEERAYLGYYHWQVFVRTTSGDVPLEEGYGS
jgi:membrane-bound lytic murein transglycosylase B